MTPVLIILIVMSFAALMAKMGMDHDLRIKQGRAARQVEADNSLKVSELNEMIRQAVREASAPLQERIASLEARIESQEKRLPPASSRLELEEGRR